MTNHHFLLNDEAGTAALGSALARICQPGLVIYLNGELGTGKTALTRALLHAAGHQGSVKSPTYALVEPYQITLNGALTNVMHFDLYRLHSAAEFSEAGLLEEFNPHTLCLIEWPEKAAGVLPPADIEIKLEVAGNGRAVELFAHSDQGTQCVNQLHFAPNL